MIHLTVTRWLRIYVLSKLPRPNAIIVTDSNSSSVPMLVSFILDASKRAAACCPALVLVHTHTHIRGNRRANLDVQHKHTDQYSDTTWLQMNIYTCLYSSTYSYLYNLIVNILSDIHAHNSALSYKLQFILFALKQPQPQNAFSCRPPPSGCLYVSPRPRAFLPATSQTLQTRRCLLFSGDDDDCLLV